MSTPALDPPVPDAHAAWVPAPRATSARDAPLSSPFHSRLLERWHLLSLDAPTIATLWTWFLARCASSPISRATLAATLATMFVAVWMLYAADRLLDGRAATAGREAELEERHRFHARHARAFLLGLAGAAVLLAGLLVPLLARMPRPLAHSYTTLAALLAAWLLVVHRSAQPARLPKELVVSFVFALAVSLPALPSAPGHASPARPAAALFVLCLTLACLANCFFVLTWETHPLRLRDRRPAAPMHPSAACAIAHLYPLALAAAATCLLSSLGIWLTRRNVPLALPPLASAATVLFLLALHRLRHRINAVTLRALADAALLSPILFAWMLHPLAH